MYRDFIKPLFDFISALIILIITSPVWLLTILLLSISAKGKVWFIQQRPGKHGRPFNLIKFKTMSDTRDKQGELLSDEARLTAWGKFIRKTSIDELPQLLNVLKGNMSIVGPRPLLMEYLPLYNEEQQRRHELKPGITGWAQVNGRNTISWQDKFKLDVWYVNNISFLLDIKILLHTLLKVFKAEGINATDAATMSKFEGNKI